MLFLVHGLQLLFGYHCEKWAAGGVAEAVRTVLLARPVKTQAAECLAYVCVCVLVAQSCPILCDPMDCSLPGSSVHGISLCVWVCGCMLLAQSCLTFCNPMQCSSPGSSVHGTSRARILKWVTIPFSRGSSQPRDQTQVSHIAGRFSTIWATREAQYTCLVLFIHLT